MSLGKNASVLLLRSGETIKIDGSLVYEHDLSVGLLNTNRVDGILMDDILLTGREQNVTGIHLNRVVTISYVDQNNVYDEINERNERGTRRDDREVRIFRQVVHILIFDQTLE